MQLSIIVINFNTFELTCECIRSILKNTRNVTYEIILVDNASVECPPEAFKNLFPSITLLAQETNLGFAGGNNAGLKVAKGDVILLLNSDTEILDNAIGKAYSYLVARPDVGVVSSKLIYPSGEIQGCCQRFPSIRLEILELTRIQKLLGSRRPKAMLGFFFDHKTEMECDWVWGTFFMVKREVIEKLGGEFPADYFMYGEDMEWCYLIRMCGYKVMYYPEAVVIHHVSMSSSNNVNFDKQKVMRDNEFSFLRKYYGAIHARVIFILRSLNYLTLGFKDKKFKQLAVHYFQRAFQF
jgi:GT2 family glycosyltransferase